MQRAIFISAGLAIILAARISVCIVDPDLWHEMALGREIVQLGYVPHQDSFAYTPTVSPVVHHEWGAGLVAYAIAISVGAAGIVALKYLLAFSLAVLCWRTARQRGASVELLSLLAPAAIWLADLGFSTVRAQMYSYLAAAALLLMLEQDRRGKRRWIAAWLAIWILWLNCHAGFLVGAGWFALNWAEQAFRRQPHRHLFVTGVAMIALVLVNPFGFDYYRYLWHASRLDRPYVLEWSSVWHVASLPLQVLFLASFLLVVYAVAARRLRHCSGLLIVVVTAYLASQHARLLPFYAIAWICHVPGYLDGGSIATAMQNVWQRWDKLLRVVWVAACCLVLSRAVTMKPLQLLVPNQVPAHLEDCYVYPVGAVQYLQDVGFRGNLMTHFNHGSYVMWKLHPHVKVSMDGRYEVAYAPDLAHEIHELYTTGENWETLADRYGTDAVLVPSWSRLKGLLQSDPSAAMADSAEAWRLVYVDDSFSLYVRQQLATRFDIAERTRDEIVGAFP